MSEEPRTYRISEEVTFTPGEATADLLDSYGIKDPARRNKVIGTIVQALRNIERSESSRRDRERKCSHRDSRSSDAVSSSGVKRGTRSELQSC